MAEGPKRSKGVRRAEQSQLNDLYRTWARIRWPGAAPDVPDWSDVETAFRAGFYLAQTEGNDAALSPTLNEQGSDGGGKGVDRGR